MVKPYPLPSNPKVPGKRKRGDEIPGFMSRARARALLLWRYNGVVTVLLFLKPW